jgi:endoglucanase
MLASLLLAAALAPSADARPDVVAANKILGRGMNLGNALEAPTEGEWGLKIEPEYVKAIKAAGFDSVRVPVKWSAHAAADAPYAIDPDFFRRIDEVLDQAEANRLNVVLDLHHYDGMDEDPDKNLPRLVGLWKQIAARYKDRPASVCFELDNEPHNKLTEAKWNEVIPPVLAEVRKTNPTRPIIVGPAMWNGIGSLRKLKLPDDPNLFVTVHYYSPFEFTHQGAEWAPPKVRDHTGVTWVGNEAQTAALRKDFDAAAQWAKENHRPIYLGEFGSYSKADMDSRAGWTRAVVHEAEARGFSWAYWEFGSGFGAYDRDKKQWRQPLLDALMQK